MDNNNQNDNNNSQESKNSSEKGHNSGNDANNGRNNDNNGKNDSNDTGRRRYNNNSDRNNRNSNSRFNHNKKNDLIGTIEELGSHVFDCTSGASDLFEKTSRRLADYVGKEYGGAMRFVVENHKIRKVKYPLDLDENASVTEKLIYDAKVKEIVKKR